MVSMNDIHDGASYTIDVEGDVAVAEPPPQSPFWSVMPGAGGGSAVHDDVAVLLRPETVIPQAHVFMAQLASDVAPDGTPVHDVAEAVARWVAALASNTLVTDAREQPLSARVLHLLHITGAKAKPVLRVLYSHVGKTGRAMGLGTAKAIFASLGYPDEPKWHPNRVRG